MGKIETLDKLIRELKSELSLNPSIKVKVKLDRLMRARHNLMLENERMILLGRMFEKVG